MAGSEEQRGARVIGKSERSKARLYRSGLTTLCDSLQRPSNRAAFRKDERAYCRAFSLHPNQEAAIAAHDVEALLAAGGELRHLKTLADIWGVSIETKDAAHHGMSVDVFRAELMAASRWKT
ncbi:MAG: protocatechuate 3,4-dioxygenase [Pseudomonadota bacterium]